MAGVIDYAGLFPPAKLPLDEALRNYTEYVNGPEAWLVSRFVIPVARLRDVEAHKEEFAANDRTMRFSVIGRGGETEAEFRRNLEQDAGEIREFHTTHAGRCVADAFEVKAPAATVESGGLDRLLPEFGRLFGQQMSVFIELHFGGDWRQSLPRAVAEIRAAGGAALKVRTGGVTAEAFPTVEQLALLMGECVRLDLPFKATAGLHHPVRWKDDEIGVWQHGFINLLVSAVLARVHKLPSERIEDVLGETDAAAFRFDDDAVEWSGQRASLRQIEDGRRFVVSFGSCSAEEPIEDLAKLGYALV
ncbi:MAG: hypothetical protein IH851_09620 [Armatimonadetes bacterium]|nr:hypothetical protein [Armatimonadota bacterium]